MQFCRIDDKINCSVNKKEANCLDNEKINGIPEEEAEAEVVQDTENSDIAENTEEESVQEETLVEESPEQFEETVVSDDKPAEESEQIIEEIDESELCLACGEHRKEKDSDYCRECEEAMLTRKIPFLGWVSGLAAVVLSVFALALAILVSAPSIQVAKGDAYAKDKCWYTAYKEYGEVSSVVEEIHTILGEESPFVQMGTGVNVKIVDSVANAYSPLEALSIAERLFGDKASDIPALKKYNSVRDEYLASYKALKAPIEAMTYGEADAATTYAAFESARGGEGVNDVYIDYFLFNAAAFYGDSTELQLKHLEATDAAAKASGKDYSWLYCQDYADLLFEIGEYEKAKECVDELIESDKTKFGAYELKLKILLANGDDKAAEALVEEFKENNDGFDTAYTLEATNLRVKGKTENAKELLTEALESYDSIPELHRQMALVLLLEGDYDGAYEEVFIADNNAYYLYAYMGDSSSYTVELNNTLYLCTYLAKTLGSGETENATYFDDILGSYNEEDLSDEVKSIISGEKTVEEVLTKGACDVA